ncbi:MAG: hypothetical protein MUC49_09725 [Raineya sp.]|jgi:hypothetical protein|nr:hypothetical protein [Raineya sp.]
MKNILYVLMIAIMLSSCYGVNERTSHIGALSSFCLPDSIEYFLQKEYSVNTLRDQKWIDKCNSFRNKPFPSIVIYFNESPKELVGIAQNFHTVRYVYNPNIRNQILDGLDSDLSDKEKKRILKRVQLALIKYQCEKGKEQSINYIKNELE